MNVNHATARSRSGRIAVVLSLVVISVVAPPRYAGRAAAVPVPDAKTVCVISPDLDRVLSYNRTGTSWSDLGGDAAELYAGAYGLFATKPASGDIYRFVGANSWTRIGGPGRQFAVTSEGLYGITPDGQAVARYNGTGTSWTRIGGPAERLYAGWYGLFATAPGSGELSRYVNGRWEVIGAGGSDFAVTNESIYGISADGQGIWRYNGTGSSWTRIGGPALRLFGGTYGIFALWYDGLIRYQNGGWTRISDPAETFAVTRSDIYRVTLDGSSVERYEPLLNSWQRIGPAGRNLVAC